MSGFKKRFETIIQKLRDHHHKITPQRFAIVEILSKSDGHPSVEDIYGNKPYPHPHVICIKCKKIISPNREISSG